MPKVTHQQPGRLFLTIALVVLVGIVPLAGVAADTSSPGLQPSLGQQLAQPKVIVNTSFLNVRSGPGAIYSIVGTLPGGVELPVLARNRNASWWQVESPFGIGWVSAEFVIPRGDFRPVPVAEVTGITTQPQVAVIGTPATVYVMPDTSSSVLGLALVASALTVTGRTADGGWWQVETNVGLGWVQQAVVTLRGNASAVPVVGAQVEATNGFIPAGSAVTYAYGQRPVAYLYAGDVQLVSGPDDGEVVDWLRKGDRVEVLSFSEDGEWALVTYMGNRLAWLRVADVAISDPSDWRTQVIFYRTPFIDLKASPSYSAENTAFIEGPAQFSVLDARDGEGGQWFMLNNAAGQGWAPAEVVEIIRNGPPYAPATLGQGGGASLSGAVIQPSGAGVVTTLPQPVRSYVIINTSYLNIRSGPSASFTTVMTVSGGTEFDADAQTPDGAWLRVSGPFGTGWVNAEFVIFRGDYGNLAIIRYQDASGPTNVPMAIVSAPINVYRRIGIDSGLLGTAPAGLNLQVTGRTLDGSWLRVQTDLGDGWVLTSTVTFQGNVNLVPIVG
jgi:uncharacterized protein YraI